MKSWNMGASSLVLSRRGKIMTSYTMILLLNAFGVCIIQCQSNFTTRGHLAIKNPAFPRHRIPEVKLTDLEEIPLNIGNYTARPIDIFKEDIFQRGTFLFNSRAAIMRYAEGATTAMIPATSDSNETSSTGRFTLISDFVQHGESKMAISDLLLGCVQEYDFVTENFTTLLGVCDRDYLSVSIPQAGQFLPRLSKFMLAPSIILYVENGNYFIVYDFAYKQIIKYQMGSDSIRLLDSSLYEKLPNLQSMLTNKEGTKMYVSHSYGLSVVDLQSMQVSLLVGERVNDRGVADRPLIPGSFDQASMGKVESLRWIYDDEVLAGIKSNEGTQGLVIFDLHKRELTTHCLGNSSHNTTVSGNSTTCKLNAPTALSVSNGTIYVATLTEGNPDSYTFTSESSLYRMRIVHEFCVISDQSIYKRVWPKQQRYFLSQTVAVKCSNRPTERHQCIRNSTDPTQYVWNKPLPLCS